MVDCVLAAWLDQEEERRRLTLAALADVEQQNVIEHESVETWAASLTSDKLLPVPR